MSGNAWQPIRSTPLAFVRRNKKEGDELILSHGTHPYTWCQRCGVVRRAEDAGPRRSLLTRKGDCAGSGSKKDASTSDRKGELNFQARKGRVEDDPGDSQP